MTLKTFEKLNFLPQQIAELTVAKNVAKEASRGYGTAQVERGDKGGSTSKTSAAGYSVTRAIQPPETGRTMKNTEASSRVLTIEEGNNVEPIELRKGQSLVLELKSNPTTGFKWIIDKNMVQPKVTLVSDKAHHNDDDLAMPVYGRREQVNHFTWTAKQLATAGSEFTVTVRFVRRLEIIGETHFKIKVMGDRTLPSESIGCTIQ